MLPQVSKIDTIKPHYHNNYELYFFLEGKVKYKVGDKCYDMTQGDFLLITPNVVHNPTYIDENYSYRRFVLWLGKDFLKKISTVIDNIKFGFSYAEENQHYLYHLEYIQFNELFAGLLELWQEYNENQIFKNITIIIHIISVILKINRIIYNESNPIITSPQKELHTLIFAYSYI